MSAVGVATSPRKRSRTIPRRSTAASGPPARTFSSRMPSSVCRIARASRARSGFASAVAAPSDPERSRSSSPIWLPSSAQGRVPERLFLACEYTSRDDLTVPEPPDPAGRAVDDHATSAPAHPAEGDDSLPHVAKLAREDEQLVPDAAHVVEVPGDPRVPQIRDAAGREIRGDRQELALLGEEGQGGIDVAGCERIERLPGEIHVRLRHARSIAPGAGQAALKPPETLRLAAKAPRETRAIASNTIASTIGER